MYACDFPEDFLSDNLKCLARAVVLHFDFLTNHLKKLQKKHLDISFCRNIYTNVLLHMLEKGVKEKRVTYKHIMEI